MVRSVFSMEGIFSPELRKAPLAVQNVVFMGHICYQNPRLDGTGFACSITGPIRVGSKARILAGQHSETLPRNSFWVDRTPCWVMRGGIGQARQQCRAYHEQLRPCWEQRDSLCKELFEIDTCFTCKVFKKYGSQQ